MYGNNLSKRDALMIVALMTSLLLAAEPAAAQQDTPIAPEAMDAGVEASADLDITLQVVEDAGSAEDLLNTIELPEEARGGVGDMGDVNGLLESLRGDATAGAEAGSGG